MNSMIMDDSTPVAGIGTTEYTCTESDAGFVSVEVKSTIPNGSGLLITIKQNAATLITVGGDPTNPTPTQQSIGAATRLQCIAGDVISVVLSSASNVDTLPNEVKSVINLYKSA